MFCANFCAAFFLGLIGLSFGDQDQDVKDTIKMIDMCQYIHDHLAQQGQFENLATIECGKDVDDARAQRNFRGAGAGPSEQDTHWRSMKMTFQKLVNKRKFSKKRLEQYRKLLASCVDGLVEKSLLHPNGKLIIQIEKRELKEFDNLLKNGRPFIKRITYMPNFPIEPDFFIHLIESLLNPLTSANTIVEDIGIGTPTIGIWDRDILVETLNEKYFGEMTFNPGEKPHWEVLYNIDDEIKAKLHFCQWSEQLNIGQRFRMWRFKEEDDPFYINKVMSFLNQAPKEICFDY